MSGMLTKAYCISGRFGNEITIALVVADETIDYNEFKTLNEHSIIKFAKEKIPNREIDLLARNEFEPSSGKYTFAKN